MTMKEIEIEKVIHMNQRLNLIVGYAVGMLPPPDASKADDVYWEKYNWLMKAIENVIYLDKPLPKMP